MTTKEKQVHLAVFVVIAMILTVGLYGINKYTIFSSRISTVEIILNHDIDAKAVPIMYVADEHEESIDFTKPYKFNKINDSSYVATLDASIKVRRLRLYFNNPNLSLNLYDIYLKSANEFKFVDLKNIDVYEKMNLQKNDDLLTIDVLESKSYIELPQQIAYTSDYESLYLFFVPIVLMMLVAFFSLKAIGVMEIELDNLTSIAFAILILTIFCPAPTYNIALIVVAILSVKKLGTLNFESQKMSAIIIIFFLIYLINNLFISIDSYNDMSTIERFLPFLILSLVIPVINNRKHLIFFPISALILGFGFLATSIFDALINKNLVFLSFDFFTKYLHPIYFSYLLFFSICFVYLNISGSKKYFLIGTLFVFMVFSGSKMVLIFTLIAMFINIVRINKTGLLAIPLLLILIIFSPLKHRFSDVLNIDDTSILKEKHIDNPYDARINGLTLRLILWREALSTMNGVDYLIGTGVTDGSEDRLSKRLMDLGLIKHTNYNPHNQYMDTFWKTGLIGLICLLSIPFYGLYFGIKKNDTLLMQFSIFMIAIMFSESIFGRVNGIYFFTIVLLMLMNSEPKNEDSYIRN